MLTEGETVEFTELYLRNCCSRDAISVLICFGLFKAWCETERTLKILESCAIKQSGRLSFGEFLLACWLAKRKVDDFQLKAQWNVSLSAILTLVPPIPGHPAENSEAREVGQDDGWKSELFKAAILHISCPNEILIEPSVWTVARAAVNERNCKVLRGVLSADFVLGQISIRERPRIRNSLAFILFSLSTSNPSWIYDAITSVVRILCEGSLDRESSRLILATIANSVAENEAIERLLNGKVNGSSCLEQMLELFQNIDGNISADLFRFFANVFLVSCDVRVETTKPLFLQIVFGRCIQLLLSLDLHGLFYLLETLRQMMSSHTLRRIFVQDVNGISALFNKVDQTVLFDPHVSPRLAILLSTLSCYSELGKSLIDQGALELINHLYSRCSNDEVVRVNCVQTIGDLVIEASSHRYKFNEFRRILQDACERGTHIEVFSRALDAWGKIILIGRSNIVDFQFEFGEVITISSFLLSDSVELKMKALKILPFFLQASENRSAFLKCEDFISALSSCLFFEDLESRKDAVKSLALLARESTGSPLALQISERIYLLHGKIDSESDLIIRGMLAYLFTCCRNLTDFTQKLSIVATGLGSDTNCQEAFLHVASDPEIAANLSPFFTILYDLVNRPDINLTLAKSLSAFVSLVKNHRVKAAILHKDVSSLAFRLVQTRNVYIAESGVSIIRSLIEACPEQFLESVSTPSRINVLTCLLSDGGDEAAKTTLLFNHIIAILRHVALAKKSTNTLLINCLGLELRLLVETLIDRRDTPFLATIAWNVRVQRIIISNAAFLEELVIRIFSGRQTLIDSMEVGRFQGDNSDNILASLQILADLVSELHCNTCCLKPEGLRILLGEIPALILNVANLDEVGRLRPSAIGSIQIPSTIFILLLQILRENTKCLKHFSQSINQIKQRLSKLWQIGTESQRVFGAHSSPVFIAVLEALTVFGSRVPGSLDRVSVNSVLKAASTCPRECVEGTLRFCLMLVGTKHNVRDLVIPEFAQVASILSSARGDSGFTNDDILFVRVMTQLVQVCVSPDTITNSGILGVFPGLACTGKFSKEKLIAKAEMVNELMHFLHALSKKDSTILTVNGQVESFIHQVDAAFRGIDDELIRICEEIRSCCTVDKK